MKKYLPVICAILLLCISAFAEPLPGQVSELRVETENGYRIDYKDEDNRRIRTMYFDAEGAPSADADGCFGIAFDDLDQEGRPGLLTYLDEEGQPGKTETGYTSVRCEYDENGNVLKRFYFDSDGRPFKLADGEEGVLYVRDEDGNIMCRAFLNKDGEPVNGTSGYSIIRFTRDDMNRVVLQTYYDALGDPCSIGKGRYGIAFVYQDGELVRNYFTDKNGREIRTLVGILGKYTLFNILAALALIAAACLLGRKQRCLLFLVCVIMIILLTLGREPGKGRINLQLFWSYRQIFRNAQLRDQIINNIALFIPFGGIAYLLWPRKRTFAAAFVLSAAIEGAQYLFSLGLCETDDVISNGLGGVIGCIIAYVILRRFRIRN